jgi:hypothetical protein
MSDTEPCNAQRSAENADCVITGGWVHIRRSNLQALRHQSGPRQERRSPAPSGGAVKAGVRYDAAAELFIDRLPKRPGPR